MADESGPTGPARFSRRALLAAGGAVALGAVAVPVALAVRGSGAAADGPPLPDLPELATATASDGARTAQLTAAAAGTGLAYNGSSPGPLLRLREGDRMRLSFRNDLDAPSSLHLHGLPLTPAVDAPLTHLMPGESDVRHFAIPPGTAGTYWYHPHAHGDVERQLLAGLAGPVVITGPTDDLPGLADADDRLLAATRVGTEVRVNGVLNPVLTPRAGRLRLRLLNATAGDHLLVGLVRDGRRSPMHLVATDAGFVERPVELQEVLLAPGERAEVLVDTSKAGRAELQALPYSTYGPGGATSDLRPLVVLDVPTGLAPVPLPTDLAAVEKLDPDTAVETRRLVLDAAADGLFTIDGQTFDHGRTDTRGRLGTMQIWEIVNAHSTDHPFHLHTYPVQVIDRNGVPDRFRAWRDTVNIAPGETVRLAVPLRMAPGRTVYHCHIASHEDLGMMGILEVTA